MTNKPTHGLPPGSAAPADTQEMKEGPGGEAGAFKETSQSRDQGALDVPILSQSTNQARRGSRKRPDPPWLRRVGTCHDPLGAGHDHWNQPSGLPVGSVH